MTTLGSGHDEFDRSTKKRKIEIDLQKTLIVNLPEHLIIEHILPRLPVKSLIRFKTVCKLWLSIISTSEFAQSHLKFSSLNPKFVILSEDHSLDEHYKLFLLNYDENNDTRELIRLNLDQNWVFTNLDVVGSCNGLLCLYLEEETKYGSFCVWNPVTNQCREIKNPNGEAFALDFGFGYASTVDDYKIVALFSPRKHGFGDLYVYSLKLGQWKRIDGLDGFYAALSLDDMTIVINDTLYWPLKNLNDWQKAKCIVGFDLVDEKLKEIPWMNWFNQYKRADFFGMKGCLSLHCHGDQGSDVWVLKQYGDGNSWEKLFSVNLGGMSFLNFTETGKCLVKTSDRLKVIDPSQENPEESQVGVEFSGQIAGTGVYVESFISPFVTES
ncbi:hypothetical protein RND81_09G126400 [Saponaria officinalis]|uniref:F-box domain-containing protein n=1 Tax=Saponaria officinalis TaxID=3572 RepID=A0AAW1IKV3_SAPOF